MLGWLSVLGRVSQNSLTGVQNLREAPCGPDFGVFLAVCAPPSETLDSVATKLTYAHYALR
jgi:hypothetical protein